MSNPRISSGAPVTSIPSSAKAAGQFIIGDKKVYTVIEGLLSDNKETRAKALEGLQQIIPDNLDIEGREIETSRSGAEKIETEAIHNRKIEGVQGWGLNGEISLSDLKVALEAMVLNAPPSRKEEVQALVTTVLIKFGEKNAQRQDTTDSLSIQEVRQCFQEAAVEVAANIKEQEKLLTQIAQQHGSAGKLIMGAANTHQLLEHLFSSDKNKRITAQETLINKAEKNHQEEVRLASRLISGSQAVSLGLTVSYDELKAVLEQIETQVPDEHKADVHTFFQKALDALQNSGKTKISIDEARKVLQQAARETATELVQKNPELLQQKSAYDWLLELFSALITVVMASATPAASETQARLKSEEIPRAGQAALPKKQRSQSLSEPLRATWTEKAAAKPRPKDDDDDELLHREDVFEHLDASIFGDAPESDEVLRAPNPGLARMDRMSEQRRVNYFKKNAPDLDREDCRVASALVKKYMPAFGDLEFQHIDDFEDYHTEKRGKEFAQRLEALSRKSQATQEEGMRKIEVDRARAQRLIGYFKEGKQTLEGLTRLFLQVKAENPDKPLSEELVGKYITHMQTQGVNVFERYGLIEDALDPMELQKLMQ